ncbi:unnamed protein product [Lymnaea stagnalis]|uniref:G-protein coupled receptors family 1 profile domain-containing protein n=1 Tax=Lymnaea stagnalis TaxID=6523 RepID=A0AAV2IAX6_LYMST
MDLLNSFISFQSPDIDERTYLFTSRGLSLCFIALIIVMTVSLIFKNVRRCDFYLKPKNQTIISLAIGDLFCALYSLTALARSYFESDSLREFYCSVEVTPVLYRSCLLNFLHAFGLMALGIELLLRHRISHQANSRVKKILIPLLFSAGPWLLALVLMLPICSVSFSTSELSCRCTQNTGGVVASIIIPAFAAVIVSIFVNCRVLPTAQYQQPVPTQVIAMTTVSTTSTLQHIHDPGAIPGPPQANGYPAYLTPQPLLPGQNAPQDQQIPKLYNPNVDQQPYIPNNQQPDVDQQPYNPHTHQPHVDQPAFIPSVAQQPNNGSQFQPGAATVRPGAVTTTANINTEKARLMSISICFLVFVLPYAIFQIGYENNSSLVIILDVTAYTAISDLVMWLMVFRSYLTPAMMWGYSDA